MLVGQHEADCAALRRTAGWLLLLAELRERGIDAGAARLMHFADAVGHGRLGVAEATDRIEQWERENG
jgi:hypothetical protein